MSGLSSTASRTETKEVMSCSPAPARSTGLVDPGRRRQQLPQCGADLGSELGHRQPGGIDHVGCESRVTAAVGDHAHPVHGVAAVAQQRCGGVGELAGAGDAMDACGVAGRVDDGAVGGERAGVRLGAADRRLASADGEQQHRLAGLGRRGRRRDEGAAVAEVLAIDGNEIGVGVVDAGLDEVGRAEVGLIAEGDEAGEPVATRLEEAAELQRHVPALRQERNSPGRQRV